MRAGYRYAVAHDYDVAVQVDADGQHDPRYLSTLLAALDGGADGVDLHRRLAAGAVDWLVPDGVLLVETSPSQTASTTAAMAAAGMAVEVVVDDEIGGCVAVGRRGPAPGR